MADVKITITYKEEHAMVGIGSTEADPLWFPLVGSLEDVLAAVPSLVTQAQERWEQQAKYPTYNRPAPPPPSQSRTVSAATSRQKAPAMKPLL